jgi:hypothetical protein
MNLFDVPCPLMVLPRSLTTTYYEEESTEGRQGERKEGRKEGTEI